MAEIVGSNRVHVGFHDDRKIMRFHVVLNNGNFLPALLGIRVVKATRVPSYAGEVVLEGMPLEVAG